MFAYHWLESTLDKLADIFIGLAPADRDRMADGVEAFNTSLANDPLSVGESRHGGYRVAFPPLLSVYFRVDVAKRQVLVTDVARFGR